VGLQDLTLLRASFGAIDSEETGCIFNDRPAVLGYLISLILVFYVISRLVRFVPHHTLPCLSLKAGLRFPVGGQGTEFGGLELVPSSGVYLARAAQAFFRMESYF